MWYECSEGQRLSIFAAAVIGFRSLWHTLTSCSGCETNGNRTGILDSDLEAPNETDPSLLASSVRKAHRVTVLQWRAANWRGWRNGPFPGMCIRFLHFLRSPTRATSRSKVAMGLGVDLTPQSITSQYGLRQRLEWPSRNCCELNEAPPIPHFLFIRACLYQLYQLYQLC